MCISPLMCLRYILVASCARLHVQFLGLTLWWSAMADLFADQEIPTTPQPAPAADPPLADRFGPSSLEEVAGKEHLPGADGTFGRMVAAGKPAPMTLGGRQARGRRRLRGCSPMPWEC